MREIKFRVWHKHRKIMAEIAGLYPTRHGGIRIQLKHDNNMPPESTCVLMQFTGLHDKSGKEIYEGDILEHWGDKLEVKPIIPIDRHYSQYDTPKGDDWMSMSDVHYEVIGNIYENPELLTQKT